APPAGASLVDLRPNGEGGTGRPKSVAAPPPAAAGVAGVVVGVVDAGAGVVAPNGEGANPPRPAPELVDAAGAALWSARSGVTGLTGGGVTVVVRRGSRVIVGSAAGALACPPRRNRPNRRPGLTRWRPGRMSRAGSPTGAAGSAVVADTCDVLVSVASALSAADASAVAAVVPVASVSLVAPASAVVG